MDGLLPLLGVVPILFPRFPSYCMPFDRLGHSAEGKPNTGLKMEGALLRVVAYGIGNIIGASIYVLVRCFSELFR